ncbi:MAG: hypothetical protein IPI12_06155 [Ignavibacteriales bacterium]|nr:hypothetical protein [Ignavibacteriales bacterium]
MKSYLINLQIEGRSSAVCSKDIQLDPVTEKIVHFDMHDLLR